MKNKSLTFRITLIAALPLLCFLGMAAFDMKNIYDTYRHADVAMQEMDLVKAASELVHETQKERGRSAAYLNGGMAIADVEEQRKLTDTKLKKAQKSLQSSAFDKVTNDKIRDILNTYQTLRPKVTNRSISTGDAIKTYTKMVNGLLGLQKTLADETPVARISADLRVLSMVEMAKENGGKLRANLSSILAKDQPISKAKINSVIALKANVDGILNAPGLELHGEAKKAIKDFRSSPQWAEVGDVFTRIILKSGEGQYGRNAKEFFATISGALGFIAKAVNSHKEYTIKDIAHEKDVDLKLLMSHAVVLITICLLLCFMIYKITRGMSKEIGECSTELSNHTHSVVESTSQISEASEGLAGSFANQAAAIQTIAASLTEITAIAGKNSESVNQANSDSKSSNNTAQKGKTTVQEMIQSMGRISEINQKFTSEVTDGNEKLSEIGRLISDIAEKTNVINDIVFQTKLLSFNASVEAARAGEYGKGFSVVAEEVGNLAKMSGTAADEISSMLDQSVKRVSDIVTSTKTNVEKLVKESKDIMDEGIGKAEQCNLVLGDIMESAASLDQLISSVAEASKEQEIGIQEIGSAVNKIEELSNENTRYIEKSEEAAKNLHSKASGLALTSNSLVAIVDGQGANEDNSAQSKTDDESIDSIAA